MKSSFLFLYVLLIVVLLSGCETLSREESQTPTDAAQMPLGPDEILRIRGEDSYVSQPVLLEGDGALRTYYRQNCNEFVITMENNNPALANAPKGRVILAAWREPFDYVKDDSLMPPFEYIAGEYVFKVDVVGPCEWEVWLVLVSPMDK